MVSHNWVEWSSREFSALIWVDSLHFLIDSLFKETSSFKKMQYHDFFAS